MEFSNLYNQQTLASMFNLPAAALAAVAASYQQQQQQSNLSQGLFSNSRLFAQHHQPFNPLMFPAVASAIAQQQQQQQQQHQFSQHQKNLNSSAFSNGSLSEANSLSPPSSSSSSSTSSVNTTKRSNNNHSSNQSVTIFNGANTHKSEGKEVFNSKEVL